MSDDELESMLADLESEGGGSDLENEDADGVLSELEQDLESSSSPREKTADPDLEAPELAAEAQEMGDELDDLGLDEELPVEGGEGSALADEDEAASASAQSADDASKKADRQKKKQKKEASTQKQASTQNQASAQQAASTSSETTESSDDAEQQAAEPTNTSSEESPWKAKLLAWAGAGAKWSAFLLPTVMLWWLVGAYLGNWISAGWLITAVSTAFVLGAPAALYSAADRFLETRGKFRWWLLGFSVALIALLVAPLSDAAGEALVNHGDWPARTIAELTGASTDGFLVQANGTVGETIGRLLNPATGGAS